MRLKIQQFLILLMQFALIGSGACTSDTSKPPSSTPTSPKTGQEANNESQENSPFGDQQFSTQAQNGGAGTDDSASDPSGGIPGGLEGLLGGQGAGGQQESSMGGGDPNAVMYQPKKSYGFYLSEHQNDPEQDVNFSCPGDSFLSGEFSKFDRDKSDRSHKFMCQFLTDGSGQPIRKANCSLSQVITNNNLDYTCPNDTFMSGQVSKFRGGSQPRSYQFECCEMRNASGAKLTIATEQTESGETKELCTSEKTAVRAQYRVLQQYQPMINMNVNERNGDVNYSCENAAVMQLGGLTVNHEPLPIQNAILRQVKINYDSTGTSKDSQYSYYCCALKVP